MVELQLDNTSGSSISFIVQQIIFNDNLLHKLRATDVIINALDDKTKVETGALSFQKYIYSIFADLEFMRQLNFISIVRTNAEVGLEYYGRDFVSEPEFNFQEENEKRFVEIERRLAKFLGLILKTSQKGTTLNL
jgi:hypothetical protein